MKANKNKRASEFLICHKNCGNMNISHDLTVCLSCGSGLKIRTDVAIPDIKIPPLPMTYFDFLESPEYIKKKNEAKNLLKKDHGKRNFNCPYYEQCDNYNTKICNNQCKLFCGHGN